MEKQDNSYPTKSLFAFCGSALIAKQLNEAKVLSDLVLSMTGNTTNGTDLVAEIYGSYSAASSRRANSFDEPPSHPFTIIPSIKQKPDSTNASATISSRKALAFSSRFAWAYVLVSSVMLTESQRHRHVDFAKSDGPWLGKEDFVEDDLMNSIENFDA